MKQIRVELTRDGNCARYGVAPGTVVEMDIESYLCGVVPSEIGNSPIEACKAQAIAARSFAMAVAASRGFVHDTSVDQAFIAANGERTGDYYNAIQAVKETRGQVLVYNGRVIAAQYGASNGGQTRGYQNKPYYAEGKDPWDAAEAALRTATGQKIRYGNRVGLSQYGARWAARQGIGYMDILRFYYPSANIADNYGQEASSVQTSKHPLNATEQRIAAWAKQQVGSGYVWGTVGQTLTQS